MYITLTDHYKGMYPANIGGIMFYSGPYKGKETDEKTGKRILGALYPIMVECDNHGKPLSEVPPVVVTTTVAAPAVKPAPKSPEDPTAASDADGEVLGTPQDQPVVEEVAETKGKKKGK